MTGQGSGEWGRREPLTAKGCGTESDGAACRRACPVCGGSLVEIRHKLHCTRCHSIVETCCEGGRG